MSEFLSRNIDRIVDWATRERHIERKLLYGGLACLAPLGFGLSLSLATKAFGRNLTISALPSLPEPVQWCLALVGALAITAATVLAIARFRHERSELDRRRVLVIEQRGLRDTTDTPLVDAIPHTIPGRKQPLIVDLRDRIKDGVVTNPEAALERLSGLPKTLEQMRGNTDPADISIVYGGLSPVPFTFLAGLLLDDESRVTVMDWDRNSDCWRTLDGKDDDALFTICGIDQIQPGTKDVAVAVSVSYGIDVNSVQKAVVGASVVELELSPRSTDSHWSEAKQQRLAKNFLDAVIRIADTGATTIHLFIAAPNSIVFRFGRIYDKRNLPRVLVYQYQKGREFEHPWAVDMPVHDLLQPGIRHTLTQ